MSATRKISKRIEFNEYEAELLRIKSHQAGIKEAQLIRELITGYAPTEAPGSEFYRAMNKVNAIGNNINQIAAVANSTGYIDSEQFQKAYNELSDILFEIKKIVEAAKPYHYSYYEKLIYEQKKARREGRPEPKFGDNLCPYEPRIKEESEEE